MPKLNPVERRAVARARLAGAALADLAEDFGVSQAYVAQQVNWYEKCLQARRERRAVRQAIQTVALPVRKKSLVVRDGRSALARELGIRIVNRGGISLPYVAFLDTRSATHISRKAA